MRSMLSSTKSFLSLSFLVYKMTAVAWKHGLVVGPFFCIWYGPLLLFLCDHALSVFYHCNVKSQHNTSIQLHNSSMCVYVSCQAALLFLVCVFASSLNIYFLDEPSLTENVPEDSELSALKKELNTTKDRLSSKDIETWHTHTTKCNLAVLVLPFVKQVVVMAIQCLFQRTFNPVC